MSDSRREKIISAYWYDKRCPCTGWERVIVHHLGRLTTMENKIEVHTPGVLLKQVKSCHFSTRILQRPTKCCKAWSNPWASPESNFLRSVPESLHSRPTGLLAVSRTPQALSYLKDFAFALLSGMRSILQLSKRFPSSLLLALRSKVREASHDRPT